MTFPRRQFLALAATAPVCVPVPETPSVFEFMRVLSESNEVFALPASARFVVMTGHKCAMSSPKQLYMFDEASEFDRVIMEPIPGGRADGGIIRELIPDANNTTRAEYQRLLDDLNREFRKLIIPEDMT
jgi:hypothetical protein